MADNEANNEEITEGLEKITLDKSKDVEKVVVKVKKPRSEKQILAFQNAQLRRQENILSRKTAKKTVTTQSKVLTKAQLKLQAKEESEDESEEEEVIYVKSQKKPKMPKKVKKKTVIIEESSDEESSEDEEPTPPPSPKQKSTKFLSQCNKKYSAPKQNMFCD